MASTTSHHDESRKGVGTTAHGVAYMRQLETNKGEEDALVVDPYARYLSTSIGEDGWKIIIEKTVARGRTVEEATDDWVNGIAVRSRKIDDEILNLIAAGYEQIVVLGAGLDTRPWRLHTQKFTKSLSTFENVNWFEIDFPEIFQFKLSILQEQNAETLFDYHNVEADLSIDDWPSKLRNSGFDGSQKTVWLLEGLTGYLKEEECHKLFCDIYSLSAPESVVVATFITPNGLTPTTDMHRFRPTDPLLFIDPIGWTGSKYSIEELHSVYNRRKGLIWKGYFIVIATNRPQINS